jgi:Zn-finger nucleic acid-binding protein
MTRDASVLHCPNCGAAAEPDDGRCRYCRARLATVSCPACFALMFDGAAYCPSCGAARSRAAGEPSDTRCPACRHTLQYVTIGATLLFECSSCDGMWVDADVFERLITDREAQAAVLPRLAARPATAKQGPVKYRPCVRCGKMMNRVNFGRLSGAVVDVCKGHGTFLDAGELHQIVTFVHDGGLDRARAQRIEQLREEERRLEDLHRKVAHDHGAPTSEWTSDGDSLFEVIETIRGRWPARN